MGKKQKRLKKGMNSLGGAYLRALVALAEQRTRHDATVDAMAWQIKRLAEERDAARADVETLRSALCFRLGIAQASHIDAVIDAAQAQAAPDEPVVTLEAIMELAPGERLIDEHGVIIECQYSGYAVYMTSSNPQEALELYHRIRRGVKP